MFSLKVYAIITGALFAAIIVMAIAGNVLHDQGLLPDNSGSQVAARVIFPNCPRYIPDMQLVDPSVYAPRPGYEAPEPAWKDFDVFKDCIHPRQPTFKG